MSCPRRPARSDAVGSELYFQAQHHPFSSSKANRSIAPVGIVHANSHMTTMTVAIEIYGGAERRIREVLRYAVLLSDEVAAGCVDGELEKLRARERRPDLDPRSRVSDLDRRIVAGGFKPVPLAAEIGVIAIETPALRVVAPRKAGLLALQEKLKTNASLVPVYGPVVRGLCIEEKDRRDR